MNKLQSTKVLLLLLLQLPYVAASQNFVSSIFTDDPYVQGLFELAMTNHPEFKSLSHSENVSELQLKRTKYEWVNSVRVIGNINEFSINPERNQNNNFYPRYNFSLILPVGIFLQQPTDNKIAKENVAATKKASESYEIQLKLDIIKKYNNYLRIETLLQRQRELTESELSNYLILEEKFKNNDADLDELNRAERSYNVELFKQINYQDELNTAKVELEAVIASPLPDR